MIPGIPRISVYIVTYNQEDVIDRTLASILSQVDYVYEICVSDDCSTDRTWDILNDYSKNYPGLFKLNRNENNLGIFENTEKVWTMPTGDIVHDLAGDDCVGEGWFKKVVDFIREKGIDYKNELFCIHGNYQVIYPNGDSFVYLNDKALTKIGSVELYLMDAINGRGCCLSKKVLDKYERVSQGRSHIAETAQDIQQYLFAEKRYYINSLGNIYYAGIGVSSKINPDTAKERLQIMPYACDFLARKNYTLNKTERICIKYNIAMRQYVNHPSFSHGLNFTFYTLLKYACHPSFIVKQLKRMRFAFKRRFKHREPIDMYI